VSAGSEEVLILSGPSTEMERSLVAKAVLASVTLTVKL